MKRIVLPLLLAASLFAAEQSYIELGGGVGKSKDNFSTDSKKNISSLSTAENENDAFAYFELFYNYELGDIFDIYTYIGHEGFKLGTTINSEMAIFDVGLKIGTSDEWENPFLTGKDRKETDVYEVGTYLGYGFSYEENYEGSIRYEYSTVSYDKETVISDLKREGDRHILSFNNIFKSKIFNKDASYIANISYEKYNADGKASSYDNYGLELGISSKINEKISISFLSNFGKKEYEKFNSVVNKEVDVDIYGIKAVIDWERPFDWQNMYVSFKTGYEEEKANVDFYDKDNTFGIISLGYRF